MADLLAAVCVPHPFLHLSLWVTARPAMLPHAAFGRELSVYAEPGSLSELKVAASCSLIWPSLTACLLARLAGSTVVVSWLLIDKFNNACVCVCNICAAAVDLMGQECKNGHPLAGFKERRQWELFVKRCAHTHSCR